MLGRCGPARSFRTLSHRRRAGQSSWAWRSGHTRGVGGQGPKADTNVSKRDPSHLGWSTTRFDLCGRPSLMIQERDRWTSGRLVLCTSSLSVHRIGPTTKVAASRLEESTLTPPASLLSQSHMSARCWCEAISHARPSILPHVPLIFRVRRVERNVQRSHLRRGA